ncbi:MAG: hypothetical protein M3R03_01660 [Pseudomonadota bacterium]|nr:hypothetical protein [Pseudomonadota bacterium]
MAGLFPELCVARRMRASSFALLLAISLATVACGPRNKDKLEDDELASAQGRSGTTANDSGAEDSRCTASTTNDEVKRQLFARAAEIRGSNADNYQRISGFALIQLDGAPTAASVAASEMVDCRGRATLRLPPGLKVAGGRTALGGDIAYSVAGGARGTVTLGQADSIAIPLATLTQDRAAAAGRARAGASNGSEGPAIRVPVPEPATAPIVPPLPQPAPPPPEASSSSRPSFECRRARTSGERAVCASDSLAALDRTMAAQYRSAEANGGPAERRLLVQTRGRFLGYRDRCGTDACIANAYRGRMREIDDIMAGRWRGDR